MFAGSFILPSFLLMILLLSFYTRTIMESQEKEYTNTLNILSSHLVNNIDAISGLSLSYLFESESSDFYFFLNNRDYREELNAYSQYERDYITAMNNRMTLLGDSIYGVGFIPCNANRNSLFYLKKYDTLQVVEDYKYENTLWYEYLCRNNQSPVFVLSETSSDMDTISLVRAVKDIDRQRLIGYVIVDISLDFVLESLKDIDISSYSGIFLMSPQNDLLFSTSRSLSPVLTAMISPDGSSESSRNYDLYSYTDSSFRFTFYYLSSRFALYQSLRFAILLALLFYTCMISGAALLFSKTQRRLRDSISPVLSTMEKYRAGDSDIRCDISQCSISEIAAIAANLNEMIEKINRHIDNEYKFKMEQKAAEYQALQAEINPHFLHNVLNLLIAQNRLGDRPALEQSIISLSHMFRYTCEHNYNSTIKQEFDFIQDYLFLQKIRLEDRLNFQIFLEPGLENMQIPKLLIQPLVENAIIHALEPSVQNEFIQLSAYTVKSRNNDPFTIITVINSGMPYLEKNVQKRVGLKNVEERLNIFSPNSFFMIRGGPGKPTKCTILIPQNEHS